MTVAKNSSLPNYTNISRKLSFGAERMANNLSRRLRLTAISLLSITLNAESNCILSFILLILSNDSNDTMHRCKFPVKRHAGINSTGNLKRHVTACQPELDLRPQQQMMQSRFVNGSTYTREKARTILAIWIARRRRPFKMIEDPEFIEYSKMLHSQVQIPSRCSLANDIKTLHRLTSVKISQRLKVRDCHFHFHSTSNVLLPRIPQDSFIALLTCGRT